MFEELGYRTVGFRDETKVFVTLPGGTRETFFFDPTIIIWSLFLPGSQGNLFYPAFRPDKGVTSELRVKDAVRTAIGFSNDDATNAIFLNPDGEYVNVQGQRYNPANPYFGGIYILRTKEGIEYEIDGQTGDINAITDPNGNQLTFTDNGLFSSTGKNITFGRDSQGRITTVTDPMGNVIRYDYDANGDLVKVTDQEENETNFIYDETNRPHYLTAIIDPLDRPIARTEYDEKGRLIKLLNASDESVELIYDPENSLETINDGLGNSTTYVYDQRGNIIGQIDALNHQTFAEYDDNNNLTKLIDPNSLSSSFTFDVNRNLLSKSAPVDSTVVSEDLDISYYRYQQVNSKLSQVVAPTGASLVFTRDSRGNLLKLQDGLGNLIQSFTYNLSGDITSETDVFGTNAYKFDKFGNVLESTNSLRNTIMTYDSNNRLKSIDNERLSTTINYDNLNRISSVNYGNGIFVEYGYEGNLTEWINLNAPTLGYMERHFTNDGNLAGWVLPNGASIDFSYDEAGRWTRQTDPNGQLAEYDYDVIGNLIAVREQATGNITKRTYDDGGRLIQETDGLEHTTSYTYDNKGRVETITNERNRITRYSYTDSSITITDPLERKTTIVNSDYYVFDRIQYPDGTEELENYLFRNNLQEPYEYPTRLIDRGGRERYYLYDSVGNLVSASDLESNLYTYNYVNAGIAQLTSPLGQTRKYAYDNELENVIQISYGDGSRQLFDYGENNRVRLITLPSQDKIDYIYNSAGQEIRRTATRGGVVTTTYTLNGDVDTIIDPTGSTRYYNDQVGRLSGIDYPSGQRIRYEYDVLGQVRTVSTQTSESDPMSVTEYEYDETGNIKNIKDPLGGLTSFTYDDADRLEIKLFPNGVKSTFTYDDLDQVKSIVYEDASSDVIASVMYERNPGGEPRKITRENGSFVEFRYDRSLRISRETYYDSSGELEEDISYVYDNDGKRIIKEINGKVLNYQYILGYQLTEVTGGTLPEGYSFDEDGRVKEILREGETKTLNYDTYDRLIQVDNTSYQYDGLNRRVRSMGAIDRDFLVAPTVDSDLESIQQVVGNSGENLINYIYDGIVPLLRYGTEGVKYYLTDEMGSVIGLIDDSGQKVAEFYYDAFGNLRSGFGNGIPNGAGGDFRFHGQWLEEASGLYFLRARDYDTATGRFLSRDPLEPNPELPETLDPYIFAFSNPNIFMDPSGLFTLVGLNTSQVIKSNLQRQGYIALKQELLDRATGVVGDILRSTIQNVFKSLVPNGELVQAIYNGVNSANVSELTGAGDIWERYLTDAICNAIFSQQIIAYIQYFWVQPKVTVMGMPVANGFNCQQISYTLRRRVIRTAGQGGGRASRPDFIIKQGPPADEDHRINRKYPKAYLIGDIKLSPGAIMSNSRSARNQRSAIRLYAKYTERHQYTPMSLYVTLINNKNVAMIYQDLIEESLRDGVYPFIAILIPFVKRP
ncbi:MAG: RHS repeat protein [Synechococcaceae cyanobacterium SM2_3_1]|nr:RHS repeat protein [Synechococcaceae cyanobacterium SM2_3_1]